MSFLDDIVGVGKTLFKTVSSSDIASGVARAAALGFILNQVNKNVNKQNDLASQAKLNEKDTFVREQLSPDTRHSIPVVYGETYIKGIITDAALTEGNGTMWYCVTICEQTGILLSTGQPSVISFKKIYLNNCEVVFQSDGITVASLIDSDGVVNTNVNGLIKIYCYSGGENKPVLPEGYSNPNLLFARNFMPNWTVNHAMSDLVFVLVKVTYNKEKDVTSLGEMEFKLSNTLTLPGDVLNDYMTNTRYGAGINPSEVFSS